ncbi:MAG: hypothetical protein NVSMB64_29550 [Candidatus Velthaea sp.]
MPKLATVDAEAVRRAINDVHDPEMPVGLADLGVIERIDIDDDRCVVELLPTFAACPAIEIIRASVEARLRELPLSHVEVRWSYEHQWTPDRVSDAGIAALRSFGVSPGARRAMQSCPFCGSADVTCVHGFGGSACRATYRCNGCRDTFESLKPSGIEVPENIDGLISLL